MKTLLIGILSMLHLSSFAGEDLKPYTENLEKLLLEKHSKEQAAHTKLISGLKAEEKTAQSAGNLNAVLAIRTRLAEIDSEVPANPLDTSVKNNQTESTPIANSVTEKAFASTIALIQKEYESKVATLLKQLETKKVNLTKAGKIDDALLIDEFIAEVTTKSASLKPARSPDNKQGGYSGLWIKQDSGSEFLFNEDGTVVKSVNRGTGGSRSYDTGKWRKSEQTIIVEFQDGIVIVFEIRENALFAANTPTGPWRFIRPADKNIPAAPTPASESSSVKAEDIRNMKLMPGLIFRIYQGQPFDKMTHLVGTMSSGKEWTNIRRLAEAKMRGVYANADAQLVAYGLIILPSDSEVTFDVTNCRCKVDGKVIYSKTGKERFSIKLEKGGHALEVSRSDHGQAGPDFSITPLKSTQSILFFNKEDLDKEMERIVEINGLKKPTEQIK